MQFAIELEPLSRNMAIELADHAAVANVRSDREDHSTWYQLAGIWAALIVIHALMSRRFLRLTERGTARTAS
jgi:hypothetical protein